jgi:hypothetical protein
MRIGRHCLAGILRYKSARRVSPCMLESIIIAAEEEISMACAWEHHYSGGGRGFLGVFSRRFLINGTFFSSRDRE